MGRNALYYIYRNLTDNCFSVKHSGKVVDHFTRPVVVVGGFRVQPGGQARTRRENKKYVHAFVVTHNKSMEDFVREDWEGWSLREVTYNPHKNDTFVYKDTGEVADSVLVVLDFPKVYTLKKD